MKFSRTKYSLLLLSLLAALGLAGCAEEEEAGLGTGGVVEEGVVEEEGVVAEED